MMALQTDGAPRTSGNAPQLKHWIRSFGLVYFIYLCWYGPSAVTVLGHLGQQDQYLCQQACHPCGPHKGVHAGLSLKNNGGIFWIGHLIVSLSKHLRYPRHTNLRWKSLYNTLQLHRFPSTKTPQLHRIPSSCLSAAVNSTVWHDKAIFTRSVMPIHVRQACQHYAQLSEKPRGKGKSEWARSPRWLSVKELSVTVQSGSPRAPSNWEQLQTTADFTISSVTGYNYKARSFSESLSISIFELH